MIELKGKYNKAKVFTDNIDDEAISQIIDILNQPFTKGSKVRIMPDVHPGAGCVIGTTMTITNKVVPNLAGGDIGCGMLTTRLSNKDLDLVKLDEFINNNIPSGFNIREEAHPYINMVALDQLLCFDHIDLDRVRKSLGTLGGGNHFIEVNKDEKDVLYLVIHSGSRYLGKQVAEYYQDLAYKSLTDNNDQKDKLIKKLKAQGREKEIEKELRKIKRPKVRKSLAYLEGVNLESYLHDMSIVQRYAKLNREVILFEIAQAMHLKDAQMFTTAHNFIEGNILRKGAIAAYEGQEVLIPINMRDGSLLCRGKGNEDWNFSAPHGAGRIMSRSDIKELVSFEDFKASMEGIYTTSVLPSTVDESAYAYKDKEEIVGNIGDTVEIIAHLKPIYNFKAH
jgi:RNA-splicing ligase RtcB